jgi:hypothetical protein
MIAEFIQLYERDLTRLRTEIEAFRSEANLWTRVANIPNPAGNLCLHLVGNLKTYIGKNLGNIAYLRNREAEFSLIMLPRTELLQQIDETRLAVISTLELLDESKLQEMYSEQVLGFEMTTGYFLIHLAAHLSYHLGQINYLRRILE